MIRIYILFLIEFLVTTVSAQEPYLDWAVEFNHNNNSTMPVYNNGRTIGVDQNGNVFTAGLFTNSVDFDPGPGVYTLVGAGPAERGIYISKLNAEGSLVWVKQIPVLVEFGHINLIIDKMGNIYLASDLQNTADVDPGSGVFMMSPTGFRDAFVVKLTGNGDLIWAKQFGGPGDTGPQSGFLALDHENNLYLSGLFNNTVDFDPGPGIANLTSTYNMQSFIVKLNNNGSLVWAKQFGNSPNTYGNSQIKDLIWDPRGALIVLGLFVGNCDFDPGDNVNAVMSSEGSGGDGFIVKLEGNSNFIWAKTFGQLGGNYNTMHPLGIDLDAMGNIITTGSFIGNFDFDPGPGTHYISRVPSECYILKLDKGGNFIWVKTIGDTGQDKGNDVTTDIGGNIYMIGSFGTSVDFDPGPGVHMITSPHYGAEAVVKLSSAGEFVYAAPFQSLDYGTSLFRRMVMDPSRNIYVTGSVSGVVDFDPGIGVFALSGPNSRPYVLKLNPCLNVTTATLNVSTCTSYILNNELFDVSGTYVQSIPNASGCDSIITLHLTINRKRTEQLVELCIGESFFAGGAHQYQSGTYVDTLQTILGCDSVINTILVVNPKPNPYLGADTSFCTGTVLNLSPGTFKSYTWQDNSSAPKLPASNEGLYWVKVSNEFGCVATDSFMVKRVFPTPNNFLKESDSLCAYDALEIESLNLYEGYQWSNGDVSQKIMVTRPGTYNLKVIDTNGCSGHDTIIVYNKQCMLGVYIPTGFTPDNNGKNDLFRPKVFGKLLSFQLAVYNRSGNLVFQSTDPAKGWDGKVNGLHQSSALFVWVCSYHLEGQPPSTQKGTVMLIR